MEAVEQVIILVLEHIHTASTILNHLLNLPRVKALLTYSTHMYVCDCVYVETDHNLEPSANMHSEGYGSCSVCVCVSVCYHSSGGIVHFYAPTNVPIAQYGILLVF